MIQRRFAVGSVPYVGSQSLSLVSCPMGPGTAPAGQCPVGAGRLSGGPPAALRGHPRPSAGGTLSLQFVARSLQGLLSNFRLSLRSLDSLSYFVPAETLVGQFRLKVTDHALCFGQQALGTLSAFLLFPKALPRCFKLIASMPIALVVIAMNDGDRHLTIADKTAPVGVWPGGHRCLRTGIG